MNQSFLGHSDDIFEEGDEGDTVVHLIEFKESILTPSMMIDVSNNVEKNDDDGDYDNDDDDKDDDDKDDDGITITIDTHTHTHTNICVYIHVYR